MLDRLKVIKGLEEAVRVIENYVPERYRGYSRLSCYDAIALLKEQEPVEPKKPISADDPFYECGNCGMPIASTMYQFCPYCGRKVDWNA